MSKGRPTKRCSDCGRSVQQPAYPREPWQCFFDPTAELIDWPSAMKRAMYYLSRAAETTTDLDRWIEDHEAGASDEKVGQGHLALALTYARKWNEPWLTPPTAAPIEAPTSSPDGLFGLRAH